MQRLDGGRRLLRRYPAALPVALLLTLAVACFGTSLLAADKPPTQSAKEADSALKQIMAKRFAVRGVTARGQTLSQAPPFKVLPRIPSLTKFPCTNCHDNSFVDRRVRVLKDEHTDLVFEHGGGRFWCYDACHNGRDMDHLVSLRRRPIDYDHAYELCGQCHFQQRRDLAFGGHGRRAGAWPAPRDVPLTAEHLLVKERGKIAKWKGERVLLSCPACHNP
ncbi:MAG: hypothetical protein ACHQZQ_01310, partial [SAR324 cluster bacterium]